MMMTKSSLLVPFLLVLLACSMSGLGSVLVKSLVPIQNHYTWREARTFCKSSYTDLAIIYNQSDVETLKLNNYHAWFRLRKQFTHNYSYWIWPNEEHFHFYPWATKKTKPNNTCVYVSYEERRFYGTGCEKYYFFICDKDGNHKYIFINQSKTWSDAQQYCRKLYNDLAIIKYNYLDSAVNEQDFPLWTGLYRDGTTWKWSTGLSDYTNWAPNQEGDNGDCVAIYSLKKTLTTQNCSDRYPFICVKDNLVLVKKNKTWKEALEYCKTFTSRNNNSYQLVSVQPGEEHNYVMSKVTEADTDEVWTGLRFLAGNWFWINGADMMFSDLPTRPVPWQHCGAFSKNNTGTLETRDCLDIKNFLCYSTP
ncbi:Macrophage mannose receptor 1 [Channa argus]|uniref:Macrophage mannose receptor 1 n=1 Tax=Channa argus TaxID=215402 RepID=A0A6G1P7H0_CHAAH|nr:Macrophage mannose receptor 1 [Channa argus]